MNDQTIKSNSDQGKVVAMYECLMDIEHRNKKGINPILPYLEMVNTIKERGIKVLSYYIAGK